VGQILSWWMVGFMVGLLCAVCAAALVPVSCQNLHRGIHLYRSCTGPMAIRMRIQIHLPVRSFRVHHSRCNWLVHRHRSSQCRRCRRYRCMPYRRLGSCACSKGLSCAVCAARLIFVVAALFGGECAADVSGIEQEQRPGLFHHVVVFGALA